MSTSAIVKSYTEARKDLDRIAAQRKLIATKNRLAHEEITLNLAMQNGSPNNHRNSPQSNSGFTGSAPYFSPEQYNTQVITTALTLSYY